MVALAAMRVQKCGCSDAGGTRRDAARWPCRAAVLPGAWLTPALPGRAGDSQMSLPRTFAEYWLPGIAICFARIYGLPWKSGPGS